MDILVTVGMGSWPFDRLIKAIAPLCQKHNVFVQTGTSKVTPPCPHAPFVSYSELLERIHKANIVITHAGNTVRLVQRARKVPIAIARTAANGEMANDHQVEYLRHEECHGRVLAVWDVDRLPQAVEVHSAAEMRLIAERKLDEPIQAARLTALLDDLWDSLENNPFSDHPMRRYAFAWDELSARSGRHLDVGCGSGEFLSVLAETTTLDCHGVDPHEGYLCKLATRYPNLTVSHIHIRGSLPYPDQSFDSISLLDVLEHCPSEDDILEEIRRVLRPEGLLILTVPARHWFSFLDPDNVKFRMPRLHRIVYSLRFGRDTYYERFIDLSNELCGDISVGKQEHTNYRPDWLIERLFAHGFEVTRKSGANLFWRWFHVPMLLAGGRLHQKLERAIWLDGELFTNANLFLSARRMS